MTRNDLVFFTAIHEAGHGFMALLQDTRQTVQLDLMVTDGKLWGYADTDKDSPMELMAGMAAELLFGGSWHEALLGASGDLDIFGQRYPGRDWRLALQKSLDVMNAYRPELAAMAVLLMGYHTITQQECLECMLNPSSALRWHKQRLLQEAKPASWWWENGDAAPLCLDDLPEAV